MRMNLATWGNSLYSGEKIYPIVGQRKRWFVVSAVLMLASLGLLLGKGLTPGIDFTGGTQMRVSAPAEASSEPALDALTSVVPDLTPQVTVVGDGDVRIRLGVLTTEQVRVATAELAEVYAVPPEAVSFTQIGPTWGAEVGAKAIQALIVFLLLVATVMAVYFRAWRMAAGALVALLHDLLFTVGIYA
ncbi:MAG: protein translocase subunit SecF, partial [Demequina sp.]